MTGNEKRYRIGATRASYRSGRAGDFELLSDLRIRPDLSRGDVPEAVPDFALKRGAHGSYGQCEDALAMSLRRRLYGGLDGGNEATSFVRHLREVVIWTVRSKAIQEILYAFSKLKEAHPRRRETDYTESQVSEKVMISNAHSGLARYTSGSAGGTGSRNEQQEILFHHPAR